MKKKLRNNSECTLQPMNQFTHFIGPNPSVSFNQESVCPRVDPTSFVGPFSSVIGDVEIEGNVFIAPNVSVRADEGFPFFIGRNTNLQDGVIVHGLKGGRVFVGGKAYSVYIGRGVSCAHGCLVHGPCLLGDHVFVGFDAIVFNAMVAEGSYVSTGALVTDGVRIAPERFVPPGAIINTQYKADALGPATRPQMEFAEEVQRVNREFPAAYLDLYGRDRCGCGMGYDPDKLLKG